MAVGHAYVFPSFPTPVLTQVFFPKPPTTIPTCFCRGLCCRDPKTEGLLLKLSWQMAKVMVASIFSLSSNIFHRLRYSLYYVSHVWDCMLYTVRSKPTLSTSAFTITKQYPVLIILEKTAFENIVGKWENTDNQLFLHIISTGRRLASLYHALVFVVHPSMWKYVINFSFKNL